MHHRIPSTHAAELFTAGAVGIAVTTALEVVTAPYSPTVTLYSANGVVHAVKVLAVLTFAWGALALGARVRARLGAVGPKALPALAIGTLLGALPYSVVEALLDPGLSVAAADNRLDTIYDEQVWIGVLASLAMPLLLFGIVALGVSTLRRHALPAWAPQLSLATIPVAVAAGVLGASDLPVPHPPAWLFLGLAAYGLAFRSSEVSSSSGVETTHFAPAVSSSPGSP